MIEEITEEERIILEQHYSGKLEAKRIEEELELNKELKIRREYYKRRKEFWGIAHLHKKKIGPLDKKLTQNWPAYDLAKTNEFSFFKQLISELLFLGIEEDKIPKKGRRAYSMKDRLFIIIIKVYYKSDARKTVSILKELKKQGYIYKVPCFKSIMNFFNEEKISKIFDDLILMSSLPLAKFEDTSAIDGTGFSLNKYAEWNAFKWGKGGGKERVWRKAHGLIGCETNTFFSVEITKKNVGDISMAEQVIGKADSVNIRNFVKNFTADKAYSSRKMLQFISNLNMIPYIPFKKNARSVPRGHSAWSRMYLEFRDNHEDFMRKYHTRSNVETGFFMVKQRFGAHLMTRKFTANVNELKAKFLCHNICVLIQEIFERNITIDFSACVKKVQCV